MSFKRRKFLSKKHHICILIGTLVLMLYYFIIQFGTEQIIDLDLTKQAPPATLPLKPLNLSSAPLKTVKEHGSDNFRFRKTENAGTTSYIEPPNINSSFHYYLVMRANLGHVLNTVPPLLESDELLASLRQSIATYIDKTLEEALKEDKGTGCDIPKLDPFAAEVMKFDKKVPTIVCDNKDWVKCYFSNCSVAPEILKQVGDEIECTYQDILYISDLKYVLGAKRVLRGNQPYVLGKSDHVRIECRTGSNNLPTKSWVGYGIGYRPIKPEKPPEGREDTLNVLIFGFDSTSKNGFIRKMPKSYKFITEQLGATVLNGYNIVGDGTPAALFPILTGKTELELPECRKTIKNSGHLDDMPFIFYKLKEDGYRTAYYEDMPWIGTFQYRFNGFRHQPADHYLRAFYLEEYKISGKASKNKLAYYCVGGTPRFQLMMNITDQFLKLDGKRFAFTFVADITHDDFNMISNADEPFVDFLEGLYQNGVFKNTLLMVMGDHGPRYADVRSTLQGKMEERLPFMAVRLPEDLIAGRPDAAMNLKLNADTLTTAHDIHATILDVIDMREHWNEYKIKGADLPRGMTLLEPVPKNRSCSEAGIEPHWCTCLHWDVLQPSHPMYQRAAQALVDHINKITEPQRSKCIPRTLKSIDWVTKKIANKKMLSFQGARDHDGYVGKFGSPIKVNKDVYQVKIVVGPGNGAYEAAVTHMINEDKIYINTREISRTNAYNKEPECISAMYPHMNMYCYCNT